MTLISPSLYVDLRFIVKQRALFGRPTQVTFLFARDIQHLIFERIAAFFLHLFMELAYRTIMPFYHEFADEFATVSVRTNVPENGA